MYGTCRTFRHALLAELALREVDICKIVLHGDGIERTNLRTLAATDAGCLAGLARNRTLVLVHA